MLIKTIRTGGLILASLLFLTGCNPEVSFDGYSLVDDEGVQYGQLEWTIAANAEGTTIPVRVTIEPDIGEVEFLGSARVYPQETTTYTLKAEAERTDGGFWTTITNVTIHIGPRVDYDLIEDSNLRACLEETNFTHIEQFKTLLCFDRGIESLEGIQQFTQFSSASLDQNTISDYSPLSALQELHSLSLTSANIVDLTGFPYIPSLTTLVLYDNQISDIRPLESNSQLLNLTLNSNKITDTQQFESLQELDSLLLKNNLIDDASGLAFNTGLIALDLSNNLIENGVIELQTLTNAIGIDLRGNKPTHCFEYAQLFLKLGPVMLFDQCTFP
ncbi:hypothetical protein A9Q99_21470 [Gammaproteobacteria bacterium 45_16_T64]|nr:hypothetical protein A9Q99_21470 [Gammaproteobacteria bacterium 45_16_T64]